MRYFGVCCGSQSRPIGFLIFVHSVLLPGRSLPRGFSPFTTFLQLTGSITFIQFLDILAISRARTVRVARGPAAPHGRARLDHGRDGASALH
jgi:hypothetical protein